MFVHGGAVVIPYRETDETAASGRKRKSKWTGDFGNVIGCARRVIRLVDTPGWRTRRNERCVCSFGKPSTLGATWLCRHRRTHVTAYLFTTYWRPKNVLTQATDRKLRPRVDGPTDWRLRREALIQSEGSTYKSRVDVPSGVGMPVEVSWIRSASKNAQSGKHVCSFRKSLTIKLGATWSRRATAYLLATNGHFIRWRLPNANNMRWQALA